MANAITARTKELLLRSWKQLKPDSVRTMSGCSEVAAQKEKSAEPICTGEEAELQKSHSHLWVPHPRTGIYFPVGHKRVIDDIPEGASSLAETYWLRNIDGEDKPDPDCVSYPGM